MAEGDFWALIDVLAHRVDDDALARLRTALRKGGEVSAAAFQERLAETLFNLDREVLADQQVRFVGAAEPRPLSDDAFLYLRAGIVARGKETYQAVLADPAVLTLGSWDESEELLYLAGEVVGEEIDTRFSYETGSNAAYWSKNEAKPSETYLPMVSIDCRDLTGTDAGVDGDAFDRPKFVTFRMVEDLSDLFTDHVGFFGGLPPELGVDQVRILIDFGKAALLVPEVSDPEYDPELNVQVQQVRVQVPTVIAQAWSKKIQRGALTALAATCLLAVLPDSQRGRAEFQRLREEGAADIPLA